MSAVQTQADTLLPLNTAAILRAYCGNLTDPDSGEIVAEAYSPSTPDGWQEGDRLWVVQPLPSPQGFPPYLARDRFYVRAYGRDNEDHMRMHAILWDSLHTRHGYRSIIRVGGYVVKSIKYEQRYALTPDENGRMMAFAPMVLAMDIMQHRRL